MCYASPVMLRGRCSCAISGRPGAPSGTHTTRPSPSPAPKYPLSPIIPVHPRNSPVSPIIPVHTQKQGGGGGYLFSLSVLPSFVLRVYTGPVAVSSVVSPSCPAFSFSPLVCPACSELRGERSPRRVTRHSSLTPIIPAPLATAALPVVPAPIFTTTSRIHVGAPTIPFLDSTKDNPGTDLKIGHYMSKPKSTGKNACATKSMEKRNPRPPSQNEDGAPGIVC